MSDEEIDSDEEAPYDEESEDEGLVEMSDEDSDEPAEEEADPDAEDDESEGSEDADNDVSEEPTTGAVLQINQCACYHSKACISSEVFNEKLSTPAPHHARAPRRNYVAVYSTPQVPRSLTPSSPLSLSRIPMPLTPSRHLLVFHTS